MRPLHFSTAQLVSQRWLPECLQCTMLDAKQTKRNDPQD